MKNFAGAFKGRHQTPEVTLQCLLCSCFNYGGSSRALECSQLLQEPLHKLPALHFTSLCCGHKWISPRIYLPWSSSSQGGWDNGFNPRPVCLEISNTSPKVAQSCRVTPFSLFPMEVLNNESSLFWGTPAAPQSWQKPRTPGIDSPWNGWRSEEQHSLVLMAPG